MQKALPLLFLAMTACSTAQTAETIGVSDVAVAQIRKADGTSHGVATLSRRTDGLWLNVSATGLASGTYGIHLHTIGRCEAPAFTSAGPHWNPANKMHGFDNPMGAHAGDLRNLVVGTGGAGVLEAKIEGGQWDSAMDADGLSLIIHEKADDYSTDPSGNSGARVICGVFGRP